MDGNAGNVTLCRYPGTREVNLQREVQPPPGGIPSAGKEPSRGSITHATLWTLGGEAASYGIRFISSIILTRLLAPEVFGLMAVVQVFMQGLIMFSDLGVRPIIIRHERGDDPAFLNTIWTVRLIRGSVLAVVLGALAWPVATFYGQPVLALILPAASLNLLLEGLLSTKIYSQERHLARARLTVITVASSIAGIIFMIAWAWKFRSVWALVWGGIFAVLVRVVLSYVALPGPGNRFQWDRAAWAEVASFGKWIFLNSVVTFLAMQVDKLLFAKLVPLALLGIYGLAINIIQLPTMAVRAVASSVTFPAFSRVRNAKGDLAAVYDRMRLPLLLLGGGALSFLIFNGPWLVAVMYDPRYEAAGWILQVSAFGGWFVILEAAPGLMLLALGDPRWQTVASGAKILAMAAVVPLAFLTFQEEYRFPAALAGISLVEAVRYVIVNQRIRRAGLTGRNYELSMTLLMLAFGGAAVAIQHGPWLAGGPVLRGAVSFAVFTAVWLPIGLWYLRKWRKPA